MPRNNVNRHITMVISAPSGAGKTTLIRKFMAAHEDISFAISTTTRPRRQNERDGESYYFVSLEQFRALIKKKGLIEWATVHQNYYGTTVEEYQRIRECGCDVIFDVDVQGARTLKKKLPKAVLVFIVPPSMAVLIRRLVDRSTESREQLAIRIENARKELKEFANYDYVVVNDEIERALDDLHAIYRAEKCKMTFSKKIVKGLQEESCDNPVG